MYKTVSLQDLPNTYISSGMSLTELCEYLSLEKEVIKEWEKFFNLFPETGAGVEGVYSRKRIEDFIKIKDLIEKGKSLKEVRKQLFNIPFEKDLNPFQNGQNFPELEFEQHDVTATTDEEITIRPFLTQLNKANQRIEELILEKARIVENAAIEKANLLSTIETLKSRNKELASEREWITSLLNDKEQQIKRASLQENALGESLKISQELLKKKEDEMVHLQNKIEKYERELQDKNNLIHSQSLEINKMLEKRNKPWWKFWS